MTDFKTETEECEYNLAAVWKEEKYSEEWARESARIQGLDFEKVKKHYRGIKKCLRW